MFTDPDFKDNAPSDFLYTFVENLSSIVVPEFYW